MTDQKLLDSINSQLAAHVPEDQIRQTLIARGWALPDINGALAIVRIQQAPIMGGHVKETPDVVVPTSHIISRIALFIILISVTATAYGYFVNSGIPVLSGYQNALATLQNLPQTLALAPATTQDTGVTAQAISPNAVKITHPTGYTVVTKGTPTTPSPVPVPVNPVGSILPTPTPVVVAVAAPTLTITLQYSSITRGSRSALYWSSTDADSCTSQDISIGYRTSGSITVRPNVSTSYTISCQGKGGTVSQNVSIQVSDISIVPPVGGGGGSTGGGSTGGGGTGGGGSPPVPPSPSGGTYPVYSGCEAPATSYARTVYIDPVNGADTGDGSSGAPYKTFANTIGLKKLKPGDHVILLPGDHGAVQVSRYSNPELINATSWLWIDYRPGAISHNLDIRDMSRWLVTNAEVTPSGPVKALVEFSQNANQSSNIVFADGNIYNDKDSSGWSATKWESIDDGYVSRSVVCSSLLRTKILNTRFGIQFSTDSQSPDPTKNPVKGLIQDNVIKNFSGDGLRPVGSDILVQNNYIVDEYVDQSEGDGNHDDGIQSWALNGAVYSNITIDHNWVQESTDPSRAHNAEMQGISSFDGEIDNVRVTNNVVLASAYHGISWYGVNNSLIDHNTVINPTKNTHNLWIYIPKGKSGAPATGDTISNNVATGYVAGDPSVVKINDYIVTDPVATFQTFDPSSNSFNLQPKSGSIIVLVHRFRNLWRLVLMGIIMRWICLARQIVRHSLLQ
jgi:parallel beta-helix repeat protein